MASVFLELLAEVVVGDLAGFFESAPGLADFGVRAIVVNQVIELAVFDDASGDVAASVSNTSFSSLLQGGLKTHAL